MSILPHGFVESLEGIPGFEKKTFENVHVERNPVTSIRINPAKQPDIVHRSLPVDRKIPWSSNGYYLTDRPSFTLDPLLHAGCYYVQEASSMYLEEAIRQTINVSLPLKVLDLCAAPGGKSTLIQSVLSEKSLIISNEVIRQRAGIIEENCIKWGSANFVVTSNDAKDFARLEHFFDLIVVDAPCSGSGLFRKDPEAISHWSPSNVQLCAQRQQRILADVYPSLKKNGILIYATCSYSTQENELIADWLISNFNFSSLRLQADVSWNIVETRSPDKKGFCYRFFPNLVQGEGFFISCFKKNEGEESLSRKQYQPRLEKINNKEKLLLSKFVKNEDNLVFVKHHESILALPEPVTPFLGKLQDCLYLRNAGVRIGKAAHNEMIPDHHLAVSKLINKHFVAISLKREQALQYLRKQEVMIDTTLRGWILAQYESVNIGWMKHLGGRINNYYPKEWKILKSENY